jgi:hypothetical protein
VSEGSAVLWKEPREKRNTALRLATTKSVVARSGSLREGPEDTEGHREKNRFYGKSKSMNKINIVTQETIAGMG